ATPRRRCAMGRPAPAARGRACARCLRCRRWRSRWPCWWSRASSSAFEVVGVVEDVLYARNAGATPVVYLAWEQSIPVGVTLHVRARTAAAEVVEPVRRAEREAGVELFLVRPLARIRHDAAFPQRLTGTLLSIFGVVALVLASVGLYGVVAYGVAQRTHEIGVRMALGARPDEVRAMVVGGGVRLAGVGVAFGVAIALAGSRLITTLLYGVSAADPLTYLGVAALLAGVTLLATWLPARRASRVDPMVALRSE
ncbi:MAG: FtsX-like permease family protein, partial [Gemmatimonadetes bacterium]|nr:FtsX-like permease family protein [Gemmatimonadota bacterium]